MNGKKGTKSQSSFTILLTIVYQKKTKFYFIKKPNEKLHLDSIPKELQPLIHQVQGNPLYCEELAKNIKNVLVKGKLSALPSDLPNSVEGLISSRLDLLSVSAQNLLKISSVIGYEFSVAVLQGIFDEKFGNDLKLLLQQNFIHQSGASSFAFSNETTWKVLLLSISFQQSLSVLLLSPYRHVPFSRLIPLSFIPSFFSSLFCIRPFSPSFPTSVPSLFLSSPSSFPIPSPLSPFTLFPQFMLDLLLSSLF